MTDPVAKPDEGPARGNRHRRGLRHALRNRFLSPRWLARSSAVALSVTSIAFALGFVLIFGDHGLTLFVSNPPTTRAVLVLPSLVAVFAFGTTVGAVLAWRDGDWSRLGRLHQTLLAVLGLAFVWQLAALGFLP
jgi:hypothetical protein